MAREGGITRTPAQAQEHVLAERKRREKIIQIFIDLSALIPGLKKLDKSTLLRDALNYIKELQERVKKLEDEAKRNNEELTVPVKRTRLSSYVDGSSSEDNFISSSNQSLPDNIEVRTSDGKVLIRVYCTNQTGIIKKILSEIERRHLSVLNSSVMPFGDSGLYITIISQMADQYKTTAKTLVDNLGTAIVNHI